jgi:hypothetical protein
MPILRLAQQSSTGGTEDCTFAVLPLPRSAATETLTHPHRDGQGILEIDPTDLLFESEQRFAFRKLI